jgi:hypothetical protein
MMTDEEFRAAAVARPLVRYVVMWPDNGVIIQTFVDPVPACTLAEVDPGVIVVKMVEECEYDNR